MRDPSCTGLLGMERPSRIISQEFGRKYQKKLCTGTTSSSKCVRITLGMIMHELDKYADVIPRAWKGVGRAAVIHSSSVYWAASCYGQVDICLAFYGTLILPAAPPTGSKRCSMDATEVPYRLMRDAMTSGRFDTVIAGLVPTLMDAMPSPETDWWTRGGTIREKKLLVFTWGEACPQSVVDKWARATIIELLVATEYWLSLYCVRSTSTRGDPAPVQYSIVSGCTVSAKRLRPGGDAGMMIMSGRMVTPGYVTGTSLLGGNEMPSKIADATEHTATFETEDVVRLVTRADNSYRLVECLGREGDLVKVGGAFARIPALEDAIGQHFGSGTKVIIVVGHEVPGGEIHVVVRVGRECRLGVPGAMAAIRGVLPGLPTRCIHIFVPGAWIPTNAVTGKVMKGELLSTVIPRPPPLRLADDALLEDAPYREQYELGGSLLPKSVARSKKALYVGVPMHVVLVSVISILASLCWNNIGLARFSLGLVAALMVYYPLLDYVAIAMQSDTSPAFGSSIDTKDCLERMALSWAEVCTSVLLWLESTIPYGEYLFKTSFAAIRSSPKADSPIMLPCQGPRAEAGGGVVPPARRNAGTSAMSGSAAEPKIIENAGFERATADGNGCSEVADPSAAKEGLGRTGIHSTWKGSRYQFVCESCLWDKLQHVDVKPAGGDSRPPVRRPPRTANQSTEAVNKDTAASDVEGHIVSMLASLGGECPYVDEQSRGRMLAGLSSLSVVLLSSKIAQKWNIKLSPREVMAFTTLGDLTNEVRKRIDEVEAVSNTSRETTNSYSGRPPEYRINMFATHLWKRAPCDWLFEYTDSDHPMTVTDIKKALHILVDRHTVFRSYPLDPLELQDCCKEVLSLSSAAGIESAWVRRAVEACWPKVGPRKGHSGSSVPIHTKSFTSSKSESRASKSLRELVVRLKHTEAFMAPIEFHILLPRGVDKRKEAFRWFYVYVRLTHLFADGFCVAPMAKELDHAFKQVTRGEVSPVAACGFPTLHHRLSSAIRGNEAFIRLRQAMEIRRPSADNRTRTLWLSRGTTRGLAAIAKELQVPTEIVILAVVLISLGRALEWDCIPLSLMRANRDEDADQSRMFGFFAEYADLGLIPCDYNTSLFGVIAQLQGRIQENVNNTTGPRLYSTSLGDRPWTRKCFPITVNLITSLPQMDDLCVRHVSSYDRIERNGEADGRGMRPIHLYIEESRYVSTSDTDWGIRMMLDWEWFPCSWLVKYVDRDLPAVIQQLFERRAHRQWANEYFQTRE
ncbi:hypothetical protein FOL46_007011 [Perkinsus olseni]|uniref:Carrier domain-containing protein n=1 Tax=Perkinsus olseni TaxID=32597 RepID=A0A7J6MRC2_PEROL|nr:hypothetical protein FOL46_007011 [Perkinsus olseni]